MHVVYYETTTHTVQKPWFLLDVFYLVYCEERETVFVHHYCIIRLNSERSSESCDVVCTGNSQLRFWEIVDSWNNNIRKSNKTHAVN
jgi:hypothetical protein